MQYCAIVCNMLYRTGLVTVRFTVTPSQIHSCIGRPIRDLRQASSASRETIRRYLPSPVFRALHDNITVWFGHVWYSTVFLWPATGEGPFACFAATEPLYDGQAILAVRVTSAGASHVGVVPSLGGEAHDNTHPVRILSPEMVRIRLNGLFGKTARKWKNGAKTR